MGFKFELQTIRGLSSNDYNAHSFRIGAATTAAMLGKNYDEIKYMGRWKSDSFKKYIRMDCLIKIQVIKLNLNHLQG
jgi:hypothetical protein